MKQKSKIEPGADMSRTHHRSFFWAAFLFVLSAVSLHAQNRTREISVAVGAMQYDASGTGTAPIIALRTSTPFGTPWLLGEASFSYAALNEQFTSVPTRVGVAEGQVQLQWPAEKVRPYLGLGGGWLHYFNNSVGRASTPATISGAVGLRFAAAPRVNARAELRLRGWGEGASSSFVNTAAEWTAGVAYAF